MYALNSHKMEFLKIRVFKVILFQLFHNTSREEKFVLNISTSSNFSY